MTKPTATPMFAGDILAFNLDIMREELKAAEKIEEHCAHFLAAYNASILTGHSETVTGQGAHLLKSAAVKMKNATLTINTLRPRIEEMQEDLNKAMTIF